MPCFWQRSLTICFIGDSVVPKTIDSGAESPFLLAVAIDALVRGAFAIQHSVMARQGFKRVWTQGVPRHLERPTYVLAASLVLILCFGSGVRFRRPSELASATVLSVTFWLGWAILLTSRFLINHFEMFGLRQVWTYLRQTQH